MRARGKERYSATRHRTADGGKSRGRRVTANGSENGRRRQARRCDATNARTCHARRVSRPQPSTPKPLAADCAGLRPDGVLAYAERSHGRARRPSGTGRTVAAKPAAC
ncbi:MAG: hypothetical protein IKF72_12095 [Kiritimatiellae bacterium]|nr:hypothetical protein [Kiritimatiellia bacterium]